MPILNIGRIPGSLGLNSVSGLVTTNFGSIVGPRIGLFPSMAELIKRLGKGAATVAFKSAGKKLASKIRIGSKEWEAAFVHAAEHFSTEALLKKATHSVFLEAFRTRPALERMIVEACRKPSRSVVKFLTDGEGAATGRLCVIIEREFGHDIGETFVKDGVKIIRQRVKVGEKEVTKEGKKVIEAIFEDVPPCRILRVIVDVTGRPITAYPVSSFL